MLQVQHVGDQRPRGQGVHLAGDAELGQAQLADLRGALPAQSDQLVAVRVPLLGLRGVQFGPVRGQEQVVELVLAASAQHRPDPREGAVRVEVVEVRAHAQ